jgi:hypothetical protein
MPRRLLTTLALLALAIAPALVAGCYEKTVSASGFGADRKTISESDVQPTERVLGYPKSDYKSLPTTH